LKTVLTEAVKVVTLIKFRAKNSRWYDFMQWNGK
jgi:hypothetical protein